MRFNKIMALIVAFLGIVFLITNLVIYKIGIDFAKEYDAASYELIRVQGTYSVDQFNNYVEIKFPGFFSYYTEDGKNLIAVKQLFTEYNQMNYQLYNFYETIKFISLFIVCLSIFGVVINVFKRIQYTGYALAIFFSLLIYIE